MSRSLKFLFITALSSTVLISCSNEAAQTDPIIAVNEQASNTIQEVELAAKEAAEKAVMIEKEAQKKMEAAKIQAQVTAQAEASAAKEAAAQKEAMIRAEEAAKIKADKEAKAAKEEMLRSEAQAELQAAREAAAKDKEAKAVLAQAEEQRRLQQEQAAEAERIRTLEAQRIKEAQAATTQQAVSTPVVSEPVAVPVNSNPNMPYNEFLSKYVSSVNGINLVAYDTVTPQDRAKLRNYIETLSAINIEALPRDAEMATWFNLYNAKTIELILENYPTKSIRKISNPWKKDRLVVNGKKMSLDDIEHGTVRKKYDEPRVHYAFNCASIGCPNIKASAWEASTLEADLAQASRDFIASDRGVSVEGNKIIASSIFKWYKKDFGGNEAGILAHLRQYASGSKKAALDATNNINKYDYDWDLNIR